MPYSRLAVLRKWPGIKKFSLNFSCLLKSLRLNWKNYSETLFRTSLFSAWIKLALDFTSHLSPRSLVRKNIQPVSGGRAFNTTTFSFVLFFWKDKLLVSKYSLFFDIYCWTYWSFVAHKLKAADSWIRHFLSLSKEIINMWMYRVQTHRPYKGVEPKSDLGRKEPSSH